MKITLKDIIEDDSWIITKVINGHNGSVRIDAMRRFYKADEQNRFSDWYQKDYVNRLYRENKGRNLI